MLPAVLARLIFPLLLVLDAPLVVIEPPALTVRFEPAVMVPKSIALTSVIWMAFVPVLLADTVPVKLLAASVRLMVLAPALKVAVPAPPA